jgi:hypothetical protein
MDDNPYAPPAVETGAARRAGSRGRDPRVGTALAALGFVGGIALTCSALVLNSLVAQAVALLGVPLLLLGLAWRHAPTDAAKGARADRGEVR